MQASSPPTVWELIIVIPLVAWWSFRTMASRLVRKIKGLFKKENK